MENFQIAVVFFTMVVAPESGPMKRVSDSVKCARFLNYLIHSQRVGVYVCVAPMPIYFWGRARDILKREKIYYKMILC